MNALQERKAANHRLSNHPILIALVGCCLLAALIWVQSVSTPKPTAIQMLLAYGVCGGFIVFYAAGALHKVWFTAEGIEDRWCGFRYRFTPWSEVGQIIKAYQHRATAPSIVIIPQSCPAFSPEAYTRPWRYIERHRFSLIILDVTDGNLALVKQHYGAFDYER